MTYYGTRFGCRWGMPHDPKVVQETPVRIVEVCKLCRRSFRWRKGHKGRIDNVEYLKVHVRSFAQRFGATKRAYMKIYKPEETAITLKT